MVEFRWPRSDGLFRDVEAAAQLCTHYTDAATTLNEPSRQALLRRRARAARRAGVVAIKQAVRAPASGCRARRRTPLALANMEAATSAGTLGTFDRVEKLAEAAAAQAAVRCARGRVDAPLSAPSTTRGGSGEAWIIS